MENEPLKSISEGFPEFFYDLLAYVIPSVYLVLGLALILGRVNEIFSFEPLINVNIIFNIFLIIIMFGFLYLIGQLLTTFSNILVWKIPVWLIDSFRNKKLGKKSHYTIDWYDGYRKLEIEKPKIANLVTKRYSRWISSRNIIMANIILLIINSFQRQIYGWFIFVSMALFIVDLILRKKWLDTYIEKLIKLAKLN